MTVEQIPPNEMSGERIRGNLFHEPIINRGCKPTLLRLIPDWLVEQMPKMEVPWNHIGWHNIGHNVPTRSGWLITAFTHSPILYFGLAFPPGNEATITREHHTFLTKLEDGGDHLIIHEFCSSEYFGGLIGDENEERRQQWRDSQVDPFSKLLGGRDIEIHAMS